MGNRIRIIISALVLAFAGIAFLIWRALDPPAPLQATATSFELQDVTIIDPGSSRAAHRDLGIAEGRISVIRETQDSGAAARSYRGMYVLPGLIDMHSHLPPGNPLQLSSYFMLLNLAHGVTTIRNAGDVDGTASAAKREAETTGYPGPREFFCDAFVSSGKRRWANTILLKEPADADRAVAALKAKGASCVKAYDGLTLPLLQALHQAADKYGLQLLGHVPVSLRYEQALLPDVQHLMGISSPGTGRHLYLSDGWDEVDDARLEEIVRVTRDHGIANTPTLVLGQQILRLEQYQNARNDAGALLLPRLFRDVVWNPVEGLPQYRGMTAADFDRLRIAQQKKLRLVHMLHAAGTPLHLGTDVQQPFVVPGYALHQEMRLFVEASIPPEQVWELATRQSGRALGVAGLGTIETGAPADLLIFSEDPTVDLAALASLQAVVSQGRLYTRSAIEAKTAEYQAHYEGWLFDRLSIGLAKLALRKAVADE